MTPEMLQGLKYKAEEVERAKARIGRAEKLIEAAQNERVNAEMELNIRLKEYQEVCNAVISLKALDPARQGFAPSFHR